MALLLCYIPVSNTLPGQTANVNHFPGVSEKIKMFEMPVKATGNCRAQLKPNAEFASGIATLKAERKVSQLTSAFKNFIVQATARYHLPQHAPSLHGL